MPGYMGTVGGHLGVVGGSIIPAPPADFTDAVLATYPTNYWPMNEGSGTPVTAAGSISLSMVGTLSWVSESHFGGSALDWNDSTSDYLSLSSATSESSDFTWQIAAEFDSLSDASMLVKNTDDGYLSVTDSTHMLVQSLYPYYFSTPFTLSTGTWYLIHLVRSGDLWTAYVNGQATNTIDYGGRSFNVGNFGRYHISSQCMDGRMNHIARWGRALTADHISDLYAAWS